MKNEQNRYFLVEYAGEKNYHYDTREELEKVLDDIRKYNNRKNESFLIGNMSVKENNGFDLTAHMYHKLSNRCTISTIDNVTSKYNEVELVLALRERLRSIYPEFTNSKPFFPDINIAYFEDRDEKDRDENLIRRIKYIPVLYKDDLDYIDEEKVHNMLKDFAFSHDIKFFEELVNEYNQNRSVDEELDELERSIDRVKNQNYSTSCLYSAAVRLYSSLIFEKDSKKKYVHDKRGFIQRSRRRLRDFGFFIKNYKTQNFKNTRGYNFKDNKEKIDYLRTIREELIKIDAKNRESELKLNRKKK